MADDPVVGAHRDIHHREIATLILLAGGLLQGGPDGHPAAPARPAGPGVTRERSARGTRSPAAPARSGLSDATIVEAGLYTPAPGDLPRLLGPWLVHRVAHVLVVPYRGAGPFYRAKFFPPVPAGAGHTIRYYQPAGSAPRLYLPAPVDGALTDPSIALYLTEGEKKALKANQEGLPCIGLGGLWNWRHEGRPIGDLDRIDWYGRATMVVPDSDVWTRSDLLQPVYALGKELETRGAAVTVLKLPAGLQGSKVGLDDYLCAHTADDLQALPRLALSTRCSAGRPPDGRSG